MCVMHVVYLRGLVYSSWGSICLPFNRSARGLIVVTLEYKYLSPFNRAELLHLKLSTALQRSPAQYLSNIDKCVCVSVCLTICLLV